MLLDKVIAFRKEIDSKLFVKHGLCYTSIIVLWASLHDQLIIRIDERHFTEYHPPLLEIENLTLLAIQYAVVATSGLGLAFGIIVYFLSNLGSWPKLSLSYNLKRFVPLLLMMEVVLCLMGYYQWIHYKKHQQHWLYPEWFFPDNTIGIAVTQTMNVSAYIGAFILSILFFARILWTRKRMSADYT